MINKIPDFATGKLVDATKPEEKVRQAFEKILHFDYDYKKEQLDIEVPIPMGAQTKKCDIAIYEDEQKKDIIGIVEVKAKKLKRGKEQLESYMSAKSTCKFGIWTNGIEQTILIRQDDGRIEENPAATIPIAGQWDVHIKSWLDLKPAANLKMIFQTMNAYLHGKSTISDPSRRGEEIVKLIFCKLVDETESEENNSVPKFQIRRGEETKAVEKKIKALWNDTKNHEKFRRIFQKTENLTLDGKSINYVVSRLQMYSLYKTDNDVVGEAFQVFAEKQHAGEKGQFFTPRPLVSAMVKMIDITSRDTIIDTACGSGSFLITALEKVTKNVANPQKKRDMAEARIFGIDIDPRLVKLGKAYMSIMGDGKSNMVEADALAEKDTWNDTTKSILIDQEDYELRQYTKILSNPPFGTKKEVQEDDKNILKNYDLGHKWSEDKTTGIWTKSNTTEPTPKQILFIESNIKRFLKKGGEMAIVLPDGILGNPSYGYIRQWILENAIIKAVIDCPTQTFMPYTGVKTSVFVLKKKITPQEKQPTIFMAIAKNCGHTNRGVEIFDSQGNMSEDFTIIAENYVSGNTDNNLGFWVEKIEKNILNPKYYEPKIRKRVNELLTQYKKHEVMSVAEMEEKAMIEIKGVSGTAHSTEYEDDGEVRYIRTADISFMMLNENTRQTVSRETFYKYKDKQDIQIGDIIMVKDGDNRVGEIAIIHDQHDTECLVQGHFIRIRCNNIDPYLMLVLLSQEATKLQIRQRVFSQGTLSTIGERIRDINVSIPIDDATKINIAKKSKDYIKKRKETIREFKSIM